MRDSKGTLLLTVAFNVQNYEDSVYYKSRERWSAAAGLRHLYLSEATTGLHLDAHCAAWLRVPILERLRGWSQVYLDTDCIVNDTCPRPELVIGGLTGLFIARGHSGRPNSGVLLVSPEGSDIFRFCIDHYGDAPPPACHAPWENGHVIWACTQHPWRPLSPGMNVTNGGEGDIIHHTGPNRHLREIVYNSDVQGGFDFSAQSVTDGGSLQAMADSVLANSGFEGVRT